MVDAPLRLRKVPDEKYKVYLDQMFRKLPFAYAIVYADSEIEYVHDEIDLEPLLDLVAAAQIDLIMVVMSSPDDDSGSQSDGIVGENYADLALDDTDEGDDDDDEADDDVEVEADDVADYHVEVSIDEEADDEQPEPVEVLA